MNDSKMNDAPDRASPSELPAGERSDGRTEIETEHWLGIRRERLARDRRRNLIIVAAVAVVALIALLLIIWRWRASS
jgi:hypothetical protein